VLEHVPYDHLVEVRIGVPGIGQSRRDAHVDPRVHAARGLGADLDPVHLEAAIGKRSQDHSAAAADVEHPGAGLESTRQEGDVTRGDDADEALDQRLELHTGLAVVFVRVEGAHLLRGGHRMEPPQAALLTHDDGRGDALHREARPRRGVAAHDARGYLDRIRRGAFQRQNAEPVEIRVRLGRDASGPHGRGGACGARRQRSSGGTFAQRPHERPDWCGAMKLRALPRIRVTGAGGAGRTIRIPFPHGLVYRGGRVEVQRR
jgi:hypothetical protein